MKNNLIILVVGILFLAHPVFAAGDPGTTVADFLNVGIGARASGMGDAFVGIADDASAIYWNPGGLSQLKRPEAMGMYTIWLADTSYQFVGCAQPSPYGTFAGSISYFAFGNIPGYDPSGVPIGNVTAYDLSLLGSWSKPVNDGLSLGTNIKYIQETLADTNASAIAVDLGLLAKTINPKISFGASVQNIGTRMRFINQEGDLPLNIRLGLSFRATKSFTAALDFVMPRNNRNSLNLGFEYWFQQIALRAGYRSYSALGTNFSVGVALKTPSFQVDYAYVPYGDIGNTHRLSLTLRFGLSEEEIYDQ
ncbi:MAG: PorV/PorQ family protein, partial [Candidatus Margulisiibacteriota bacterium]